MKALVIVTVVLSIDVENKETAEQFRDAVDMDSQEYVNNINATENPIVNGVNYNTTVMELTS